MRSPRSTAVVVLLALGIFGCDKHHPTTPAPLPELTSVLINGGARFATNRTVTVLLATDREAEGAQVGLSESPDLVSTEWRPFAPVMEHQLSAGTGHKTLYVQMRDAATQPKFATIYLADGQPVLHLSPQVQRLDAGQGVVTVDLANPTSLLAAQVILRFDPSKLQVTSLEVNGLENHVLKCTGASLVLAPDVGFDNNAGRIVIGAGARQEGFQGVSCDGRLARIAIRSTTGASLPTSITIEDATLYRSDTTTDGDIAFFNATVTN